ncbi:F-box/WD repeat-containing protein 11 [Eurytemora carolleeae]|uniref:F-box/WD repeat-containing protein 11 n=1 Tax=Eurytemora carolleeae TaxID=1294199 RepID=UPI000C758AC0|nr:F-box/WD repeat-containing protein 11 [Eurytemora carolleeae]|eukprot:XP_023336057.1 F-box/WD repeat-containing protein 11-like [Eurytemora affinis]
MMSTEDLNDDVLEKIFRNLEFKDLLAAELCCKQWRRVISERRLFRQLTRKLCKRNISFKFSRVSYNKHLKDVRKQSLNLYKALRRKR